MCLLIESIRILDGNIKNISLHNKRFNSTRSIIYGIQTMTFLEEFISIPEKFSKGEVKCRISYGEEINSIEFETYSLRPVHSLQIVIDNSIEYSHKYSDRKHINELFAKRRDCDDILIVKNGFVTDSSYSNLVFSDGKEFFTPAFPLLKGTKREKYVSEGTIKEKNITIQNIKLYKEIHLINAFLDLNRLVIPISNINQ